MSLYSLNKDMLVKLIVEINDFEKLSDEELSTKKEEIDKILQGRENKKRIAKVKSFLSNECEILYQQFSKEIEGIRDISYYLVGNQIIQIVLIFLNETVHFIYSDREELFICSNQNLNSFAQKLLEEDPTFQRTYLSMIKFILNYGQIYF